jgi:molybdopterin-containing oxidoreductase family iron-sulfur binding subunit
VVEKCNFCAERLREGLEPACVVAASEVSGGQGALTFGDLSDPNSEVSRLLRQKHTICRKLSVGTGPNVFYIV